VTVYFNMPEELAGWEDKAKKQVRDEPLRPGQRSSETSSKTRPKSGQIGRPVNFCRTGSSDRNGTGCWLPNDPSFIAERYLT
jgi:hypothetical protein